MEIKLDPPQTPPNLFLTNKKAYVDSVLNANKGLDLVQRLRQPNAPSIQVHGQPYGSTHLMADDGKGYIFPSVVRIGGKLRFLGNKAEDYARATNTGIQLPQVQGTWFADNRYKTGTNVLNSISPNGIPFHDKNYKLEQ